MDDGGVERHRGDHRENRGKDVSRTPSGAGELNLGAAVEPRAAEEVGQRVPKRIVASVDASRFAAEDVVPISVLGTAAKGALLRKVQRDGHAPSKKALPIRRRPRQSRKAGRRASKPLSCMGTGKKLS